MGSMNLRNMQTFKALNVKQRLFSKTKQYAQKLFEDEFIKQTVPKEPINPYLNSSSAKQVALQELISSNKENAYILDDKEKVISFFSGGAKSCIVNVQNDKYDKESLTVVHTHPSFKTNGKEFSLPVSIDDLIVLNSNKALKKVVSIDKEGKTSSLSKAEGFKALKRKEIKALQEKLIEYLSINIPAEQKEEIKQLVDYCEKNPNNSDSITRKVIEKILDVQTTKEGAKAIHDFWTENASTYNLIYETDLY